MTSKEIYNSFTSVEEIKLTSKDFYCDKSGIPNENAFEHFTESLDFDDEFRLVCLCLDLRKVNKEEGYASGSRIMRKFFLTLQDMGVYAFRIHGEKFNILCKQEQLDELKEFLDEKSEKYAVYYGVPNDPYNLFTRDDLIEEGKNLMYEDRKRKCGKSTEDNQSDFLVGNKGNTPTDLQETQFHKYLSTMWYTKAKIMITEPFKELFLYIFITDFKPPYQSLPLIVVTDDLLEYRVFADTDVKFTAEEIDFRINARFNKDGRLITGIFPEGENAKNCKCEFIEKHEGISIPSNFGKRVGKNEIYPIKQNINGVCDYVLYEKGEAKLDQTGLIEIDGVKYGVYMDKEGIDLVKVNE